MRGLTASYVTTTLVTAPASLALTSLANVRDELSVTDPDDTANDARLTRFIGEESAGIARECNRVFGLATWQDVFRISRGIWGEGVRSSNNPLKLTKWPLLAPVLFTGNTHSNKLIDGIASTTGLAAGQPVFGTGIATGTTIASVSPTSIMLSAVATATASAVPLAAGMSVVETVLGVDTALVAGTDYEIDTGSLMPGDEGTARVYRLDEYGNPKTWYGEKVTVIYQAGYALPTDANAQGAQTLPSDLEAACIRTVVARFRSSGRDPALIQRAQNGMVGIERYWVGGMPGQTGAYPSDIMSIIERYRQPVLA